MINHKFYRLTEDFQTGYLLLQYAYMPYGAQPGDCDWRITVDRVLSPT